MSLILQGLHRAWYQYPVAVFAGSSACASSIEEDGTKVKRCAIPWTKNYSEYDE